MGSHTTTTLSAFIPEIWLQKVLMAWQSPMLVQKRVQRVTKEVDHGDIVHFPNIANIAAASVAADGTVTNTAATETDTTVTVNQWRSTGVDIPDNVWAQSSSYNLAAKYGEKLGYGVSVDIEDQLFDLDNVAALTTSGGGTQGASQGAISDANILAAIAVLDGNEVPMEDRSFFFSQTVLRDLRKLDKFVLADAVGQNPGPIETGLVGGNMKPAIGTHFVGTIYGTPAWWSTRLNTQGTSPTGYRNHLIHAEAYGLCIQRDVQVRELPVARLSRNIVAHAMFGLGVTRGNSGVIILS